MDSYKTQQIMIAILTDKPNVGKVIGKVVGATRTRNGYLEGNGYLVTWTFGNMLSLAMPKDYGVRKLSREDFPFIPSDFQLTVQHVRTENGWIPDIQAVLQLKVVEKVLRSCDTIIAATDASREGEMTFRYVYAYLKCTQPCLRLWTASLTDEAIRKGMENLKPDSCYDSLFASADCRNKADWILGINASYAMCMAMGLGNNSLGRVQTPILAAIARRYREKENHIPTDSWPIYISLHKDGQIFKLKRRDTLTDPESAELFYQDCKLASKAQITEVSRSVQEIQPPALFNLTQLQKEASRYLGLTLSEVYDIAQTLYEKKLISYPRTSSRYLTEDVYRTLPAILRRLVSWNLFELETDLSEGMLSGLSRSVVDEKQVHIHPAITVTGIRPEGLTPKEQEVYRLIAGRMLEAFLPSCRTETTFVKAVCAAQVFQTTGVRILEEGWHALFQRPGVLSVPENPDGLPMLEEGDTPDVCSCNLLRKKRPSGPSVHRCRTGGVHGRQGARHGGIPYFHHPDLAEPQLHPLCGEIHCTDPKGHVHLRDHPRQKDCGYGTDKGLGSPAGRSGNGTGGKIRLPGTGKKPGHPAGGRHLPNLCAFLRMKLRKGTGMQA